MPLLNINLHPSKRELRWFGVGLLAASLVIGALLRWQGQAHGISITVWSVGGTLTLLYYLLPQLQRTIYLGWMYAAYPIGWCISHLFLVVAYYLVVTPIGLILRVSGRDPLRHGFDKNADSYWVRRPKPSSTKRYFRQY